MRYFLLTQLVKVLPEDQIPEAVKPLRLTQLERVYLAELVRVAERARREKMRRIENELRLQQIQQESRLDSIIGPAFSVS